MAAQWGSQARWADWARRGWHGNSLNEQNYGDELTPDSAVFPFNAHKDGSMARFLHQPAAGCRHVGPLTATASPKPNLRKATHV